MDADKKLKIVTGLSGGVDSSAAAFLLVKQGHEVHGATMKVWQGGNEKTVVKGACYGPDEINDIRDCKNICKKLNIPLHIIDVGKEYNNTILNYFKTEYASGRTPNPCIRCNHLIKFGVFLKKLEQTDIEFNYFATGHYARVEYDKERGRYLLLKGIDKKKDQSYFLTLLNQQQLSRIIFPLGNLTKDQVRNIANEAGLKTAEKKESQDFYAGDYIDLLDELPPAGNIVDIKGEIIGKHKGICYYTIGQRKGLGISNSEPLYVISIDKERNEITAGTEQYLYNDRLTAVNINWLAIEKLTDKKEVYARIRYKQNEVPAEIRCREDGKIDVLFSEPQRAITPGQFVVFYENDYVLGGGIIE